MVMAGPRVYAKMADDGLFPKSFRSGGEAPRAAIALQTLAAIIVVWTSTLANLLSYIGFTLGLAAAATVAGLVALRAREGAERVPIPGYPLIPLLFVFTTVAASAFMALQRPAQAGFGLATALLGIPAYLTLRRQQDRRSVHETTRD